MGWLSNKILGRVNIQLIVKTLAYSFLFILLILSISVLVGLSNTSNPLSATRVAAHSPNYQSSLGTVNVLSGPYTCFDDTCYDLEVSCASLAEDLELTLKVSEPLTTTEKGTITFFAGWIGTWYWEENGPEAPRVLNELRTVGYRTAQVSWSSNWWQGAQDQLEGYAALACRPATVLNWVNVNLNPDENAYCTTGHSNGASEVGYALSQYGLAQQMDAVLFESGPNYARLDYACIQDDPLFNALWYSINGRGEVDDSFGYPGPILDGPCVQKDPNFRSMFQDASLSWGPGVFLYPDTAIGFLFGENDTTPTKAHGLFHYDFLFQAGTPILSIETVPNTPHYLTDTVEGGDAIRDFMLNQCYVRSPTAVSLLSFKGKSNPRWQPIGIGGLAFFITLLLYIWIRNRTTKFIG